MARHYCPLCNSQYSHRFLYEESSRLRITCHVLTRTKVSLKFTIQGLVRLVNLAPYKSDLSAVRIYIFHHLFCIQVYLGHPLAPLSSAVSSTIAIVFSLHFLIEPIIIVSSHTRYNICSFMNLSLKLTFVSLQ